MSGKLPILILIAFTFGGFTPLIARDLQADFWLRNLTNESALIRKSAARNLAWLRSVDALPKLVEATADESPGVRYEACRALGVLGSENELPLLSRIARDDADASVRKTAKRSLTLIRDRLSKEEEAKEKASGQ